MLRPGREDLTRSAFGTACGVVHPLSFFFESGAVNSLFFSLPSGRWGGGLGDRTFQANDNIPAITKHAPPPPLPTEPEPPGILRGGLTLITAT